MMTDFSAIFPCYNNKKATEFVLKNFRQHFPENPILLISDGGSDFKQLSIEYSCEYQWRDNIFGNESNQYNRDYFDAARTLEWYDRHKTACDLFNTKYLMLLEDDVFVQNSFSINEDFALKGVRVGGVLPKEMIEECYQKGGVSLSNYGMCGGSMYNVDIFKSIYYDIIEDIQQNQDRMMLHDTGYLGLGAVDISLVYHFGKRGYKYQHAEWLSEVREYDHLSYPIIHQWKHHY